MNVVQARVQAHTNSFDLDFASSLFKKPLTLVKCVPTQSDTRVSWFGMAHCRFFPEQHT